MATTVIEINAEAVAGDCYPRRGSGANRRNQQPLASLFAESL
jgi:hypothetical protein